MIYEIRAKFGFQIFTLQCKLTDFSEQSPNKIHYIYDYATEFGIPTVVVLIW